MEVKPPIYLNFMFLKLDTSFRRKEEADRAAGAKEFLEKYYSMKKTIDLRPYLVSGLRSDCDFLIWYIGKDLQESQQVLANFYSTELGRYLNLVYSFVAVTKPTPYFKQERPQNFEHGPSELKYMFVYPFSKTNEWYQLPYEERQKMMGEHRTISLKYPMVLTNTLYSFGLTDYDFLLAFECNDPKDFSDVVQALRETKARIYTKTDAPLLPCVNMKIEDILTSIGAA